MSQSVSFRFAAMTFIALWSSGAFGQAEVWRTQVNIQQTHIGKLMTCPAGVEGRAKKLLSERRGELPRQLRPSNFRIQLDISKMIDMMPPAAVAQMKAAAAAEGVTFEKYLERLQKNQEESFGGKPPGFMAKTHGRLAIKNAIPAHCNGDCEIKVAANVALAMAFWKSACHFCTDDFMSFLSIGEQYFIDSRIAAWLSKSDRPSDSTYPLRNKSASFGTRGAEHVAAGGSLSGGPGVRSSGQLLAYVALTPELSRQLCTGKSDKKAPYRSLQSLRSIVCSPSSNDTSDGMRMTVALLPGKTQCGPAVDYMACGLKDNAVEMSFEGISYSFIDPRDGSAFTVGDKKGGSVSGVDVLIHEVGHWFGLPHLDDEDKPSRALEEANLPDVMQNSFAMGEPCATELSLWLINNMSDKSYQERFALGGSGLRRTGRKK